MSRLEQLLGIEELRTNIDNDPNWNYFPLRTLYQQTLQNEIETTHKENLLFIDGVNSKTKVPALKQNREEKRERKLEKDSKLDDGWFGMKAKDPNDEAKNDYILLKLKNYIDPKNPGKTQDLNKMPKFFQIGTVIDAGDNEGAFQRIPRGKRKQNLVDQFLELDEVQCQQFYQKFGEIQKKKQHVFKVNQKFRRLKKFSKRVKVHK